MQETFTQGRRRAPQQHRALYRIEAATDAARELFLLGGEDAVTMRSVTATIGGSYAAIYRYFPDRIALLDAVVARDHDRVEEVFSDRLGRTDAETERDVLECAVRALIDVRSSKPGAVSLAMNAGRLSRGQDHLSLFACSVAGRVLQRTRIPAPTHRVSQYVNAMSIVDALLVRTPRSATRKLQRQLLGTCLQMVDLVCPAGELAQAQGAA